MGLKAEAPEVHRIEELESYFENTWLNGSYLINIWRGDGPRTNNHVEGWHGKINHVAGKLHPNIFEVLNYSRENKLSRRLLCSSWHLGEQQV